MFERAEFELVDAQRSSEEATRRLDEFLKQFKNGVPAEESAAYTALKHAQAARLEAVNAAEKRLLDLKHRSSDSGELESLLRQVEMLQMERDQLRKALMELGGRLEGK